MGATATTSCRLYREGKLADEDFDPQRISDHLADESSLVWLDIVDPGDEDLKLLAEEFGLHDLTIEDVKNREQRPKVEIYDRYFFVVMYGFTVRDGELLAHEIHTFVGPRFLVTLRYEPAFDLGRVKSRWDRRAALAEEGGGYLLYMLLDEVVDGYFDVVERLEDESERLEEEVFAETAGERLQERIFRLKKRSVEFRRRVLPLREVLDLLQEEGGVVTDRLRPYYRDVADHVIRTLEFIDNVRELLTTALEAYLSQVSNNLNQVMKKLTSWAAIILVPTLIAGIYGMNFRNMPELAWRFGYAGALGTMVVSGVALYILFKRRGWL